MFILEDITQTIFPMGKVWWEGRVLISCTHKYQCYLWVMETRQWDVNKLQFTGAREIIFIISYNEMGKLPHVSQHKEHNLGDPFGEILTCCSMGFRGALNRGRSSRWARPRLYPNWIFKPVLLYFNEGVFILPYFITLIY